MLRTVKTVVCKAMAITISVPVLMVMGTVDTIEKTAAAVNDIIKA